MTCFDVEEKDDECKVQVIIVAFDDSLSHNPPLALKGQTCVYKLSERATRGPALFFFFFFMWYDLLWREGERDECEDQLIVTACSRLSVHTTYLGRCRGTAKGQGTCPQTLAFDPQTRFAMRRGVKMQ